MLEVGEGFSEGEKEKKKETNGKRETHQSRRKQEINGSLETKFYVTLHGQCRVRDCVRNTHQKWRGKTK